MFTWLRRDKVFVTGDVGLVTRKVHWFVGVPYVRSKYRNEGEWTYVALKKDGMIDGRTAWKPLTRRMALYFEDGMPRP